MSRVLVLAGGVAALVLLLLDINFLSAAEPFATAGACAGAAA